MCEGNGNSNDLIKAEESDQGVLLYYKYVDLGDSQHEVQEWMQRLCEGLSLRGRIRVARDGINTTVWLSRGSQGSKLPEARCALIAISLIQVGGSMAALRAHVEAVQQHPMLGSDIDFKLAISEGPSSAQAARETNFQSLAVSLCQVRVP